MPARRPGLPRLYRDSGPKPPADDPLESVVVVDEAAVPAASKLVVADRGQGEQSRSSRTNGCSGKVSSSALWAYSRCSDAKLREHRLA
jgi:hypothetical protein